MGFPSDFTLKFQYPFKEAIDYGFSYVFCFNCHGSVIQELYSDKHTEHYGLEYFFPKFIDERIISMRQERLLLMESTNT